MNVRQKFQRTFQDEAYRNDMIVISVMGAAVMVAMIVSLVATVFAGWAYRRHELGWTIAADAFGVLAMLLLLTAVVFVLRICWNTERAAYRRRHPKV